MHQSQVHGMLNKIMIKDVACKVCRHAGVSFIGTDFEMAFHLINTHKNIHTWKPLDSLINFVMKEVVSQPPPMRRLDVRIKRCHLLQVHSFLPSLMSCLSLAKGRVH